MLKDRWQKQQDDVPDGHFNTIEWVRKGQKALYEEHQAKEATRLGSLRGGSAGALIDGQVHGECHRKAHLRFLGIDTPLDEEIELMTRQGEQNEDIWIKELKASGLNVKTQGDLGLVLDMFDAKFYGSPDIAIVMDDNEIPIVGLELKNVSAVTKAKSVHSEIKPDAKHLIQSAVYSVKMGELLGLEAPLPYQLVYSSRVLWHAFSMPKNAQKAMTENPIDVEWKWGKMFAMKPFHRIYYLDWEGDAMKYYTYGKGWVDTPITKDSIDSFYKAVAKDIPETKDLGPRPVATDLYGKSTYSPCNYCSFKDVCDEHEDNYDTWVDHCRDLANEKHKERKEV